MSIEIVKSACMGCTACKNVCPVNAIEMIYSEDGFPYPHINSELCTDCGLCEKRCPILNTEKRQDLKKAYYGSANDEAVVAASSSGGAFSVLAEKTLNSGGVVFGAAFDKSEQAVIYKSTEEVTLDELRRSKYVESCIGDSFLKAKEFLDNGRQVLFVGMPCHVTGLKLFLKKDYENLITCDFICGGAASPVNFKEHLNYLEQKYNSKVTDVNFRPKLYGWKEHSIKIDFENGKSYKNYAYLDTYFRGFIFESTIKRTTCAECKFRQNHASDIILADFWGYKALNIKDDDKGMSLMITNSDKGEQYLNGNHPINMTVTEIPLEYTEYNFKPFSNPERTKERKKQFIAMYKQYGFEKAARKTYMKKCFKFRIKKTIKGLIKK